MSALFISTPHIAGYSTDGKANGTSMSVNALSRFFNLPLTNWYPENIPVPEEHEISIDCTGKSDEDIIREAVLHTYDIERDDRNLRLLPAEFEKQRGDYPLRREFHAFSVKLLNGSAKSGEILLKLGFHL